MGLGKLSECTSHLVEYAANRGLARITRMTRIWGTGDHEWFPYYERGMRLGNLASGGSTEESGIGVPSYRRIGVTNPSHKKYTHSHKRYNRYKGSGLQTPPTRDIPIPTRDTPIKESGLETPPTEDNHILPRRDPR